jgi:glutaredoxin-like protein
MEIPEEIKEQVKQELSGIPKKVILKVFTGGDNCDYCKDTAELTREIAKLLDKVEVEEIDIEKNKEQAEKYNVERTPAILVHSEDQEWPIRFYGIPAGYEFSSLIESIKYASTGEIDLPEDVVEKVKSITSPKTIQAFVTVSCPYCPAAVITGFKFAMVNPQYISAQMIEASEFPELSNQFQVRAVPKVVIGENVSFEGALPVEKYAEKLVEA